MGLVAEEKVTISADNQITLPPAILKVLKLRKQRKVTLRVFDNGSIDISVARRPGKRKLKSPLRPFLNLLDADIAGNPGRPAPVNEQTLQKARSLVEGVVVNLDGPLEGED